MTITRTRARPRSAEGVPIDVDPTGGTAADEALEQLYAGHYVRLVRLSVLLVRDQALAEDVVQDCFVEVYRRWGRLDPAKAPAYLRQSVVNRSRSVLRHRAVVERTTLPDRGFGAPADEGLAGQSRREHVLAALATLPERQREVLALRYYENLSEKEIAAALGISQGAVKSHASRGAATLRQRLSLEES